MTSLEGVWRTGVRAVELETLMLVSSRGYPLLTMANGPLMAWRSWPDSYRSRPVRAAATTSAPWCCSPFRALPSASSAWPLSGWTRPCRTCGPLRPDALWRTRRATVIVGAAGSGADSNACVRGRCRISVARAAQPVSFICGGYRTPVVPRSRRRRCWPYASFCTFLALACAWG